jgi:hypothetical protein
MPSKDEVWLPGSFTKNFSWGQSKDGRGLIQLHSEIRDGFADHLEDVPRSAFRQRVANSGRPDYIPLNFFLFNRSQNGVDCVVYDELVFQALNFPHSKGFDLLALFAFNLSLVGVWKGATAPQRRPAMWANAYIRERVAGPLNWDAKKVNADDIESFIKNDPRYRAMTSRKLATNLNHQYLVGGLSGFATSKIERWWVNALFLALDRIIEDRKLDGIETPDSKYASLLAQYGFLALTGRRTLEKELAVKHLVRLYSACGGRDRFFDKPTEVRIIEIQGFIERGNDYRPGGAVHSTNPRILKTIPRLCAQLAVNVGFDFLPPEEIDHFDIDEFIKRKAADAISRLKEKDIHPTMTAEELMKITRER